MVAIGPFAVIWNVMKSYFGVLVAPMVLILQILFLKRGCQLLTAKHRGPILTRIKTT